MGKFNSETPSLGTSGNNTFLSLIAMWPVKSLHLHHKAPYKTGSECLVVV